MATLTATLLTSPPAVAVAASFAESNALSIPTALAPADGQKIGGETWPLSGTVLGSAGTRTLTGRFELRDVTNRDQVVLEGATGQPSISGSRSTRMLTGLVNGHTYRWRMRAADAAHQSAPTQWQTFTVDTSVIPAPSIRSSVYTAGSLTPARREAPNAFAWSPAGGDVSGWQYRQDGGDWSSSLPPGTTTLTWAPQPGLHTLEVRGLNPAGLPGATASYNFAVAAPSATSSSTTPASAAILCPAPTVTNPIPDSRAQATIALGAIEDITSGSCPWLDYRYRVGTDGDFVQLPAADVVNSSNHPIEAWPLYYAQNWGSCCIRWVDLVWRVGQTVTAAGKSDGLLQLQACSYSSQVRADQSCSAPVNVQLNRRGVGQSFATAPVGPGTLAVGSGAYEVSAEDATARSATGSMRLGRTLTTQDALTPGQRNPETAADLAGFTPVNATLGIANSGLPPLGSGSLRVAPSGSGTSTDTFASVGGDSGGLRLAMIPGQRYTFTTHEFVPASTGLTPGSATRGLRPVAFTRVGTGPYVEIAGTAPTAVDTWQRVSVTFTVPPGATEAFIRLYNGFAQTSPSAVVQYDGSSLMPDSGFGPGWVPNFRGVTAGQAEMSLVDRVVDPFTEAVTLTGPDGGQRVYVADPRTGYPRQFFGLADAFDGSKLVRDSATQITLTEPSATATVWTSPDAGASWRVSQVVEPGGGPTRTTSYAYDGSGRLATVVGAPPDGVNCGPDPTHTPGCRGLSIRYATSTTATGFDEAQWGTFAGDLSGIDLFGADPSSGALITQSLARYRYDPAGLLRAEDDPRMSIRPSIYGYDALNRLSSLTPPGLNAYEFRYDSFGRLASVLRADPDPSLGTDQTTLIYGIPIVQGAGLPLTDQFFAGTLNAPISATAVFPPTHRPAAASYDATGSLTNAASLSADWPWASFAYVDVNGRLVNSASYGIGRWLIGKTNYDGHGRVTSTWSPGNRDDYIYGENPYLDPYVAGAIATGNGLQVLPLLMNRYSYTGAQLTQADTPISPSYVNGSSMEGWQRTTYTYDEGAPGGGVFQLPTTIVDAFARNPDPGQPATTSFPITRRIGYAPVAAGDPSGWTLHQATSATTVMGTTAPADITSYTRYNERGQVFESRQPNDPGGTTAHTSRTTYYTATGTGPCVNRAMAGWVCQVGPAAQPSTGPRLPTTTFSYNLYGQPTSKTENNGTTTRTTTVTYDTAGRPRSKTITVTPTANGGTPVPAISYDYDVTTGLPTTTTAAGSTIRIGYDAHGRVRTYQNGTQPVATTSYDAAGRVSRRDDGLGVTTYAYDTSTEHRGLVTSLTSNDVGTFTATYDGDGRLRTETFPNGIVATRYHDSAGRQVILSYTVGGTTLLTFSEQFGVNGAQLDGEWRSDNTTARYAYDNAGRVVSAQQFEGPFSCSSRRTYSYDADSNRSGKTTLGGPGGGCTTTGTPTPLSYSYDEADRANGSGYVFDELGRITRVPARDVVANTPSSDLQVQYFANDRVAVQSQTGSPSAVAQYTLDPAERILTHTICKSCEEPDTEELHYADASDSPAWISYPGSTPAVYSRFTRGINGRLAAEGAGQAGGPISSVWFTLTDPHGNVAAKVRGTPAGNVSSNNYDEFGLSGARCNGVICQPDFAPYGWLGGEQRSDKSLGGTILMGQRLYNPTTGRFLQPDPVPGGAANSYDYANQDPINQYDLAGTFVGNGDCNQARCHNPNYDAWIIQQAYNALHGLPFDCSDDSLCVQAVSWPWTLFVNGVPSDVELFRRPGDMTLFEFVNRGPGGLPECVTRVLVSFGLKNLGRFIGLVRGRGIPLFVTIIYSCVTSDVPQGPG